MFTLPQLAQIDATEFRSFLLFENNKHWSGLHRMGSKICVDMDALRSNLVIVVDESQPIATRLDVVVNSINGMGKAIVTAILQVAYPDKYGVWNSTSEDALVDLELLPIFQRGESFGSRYVRINEVLSILSSRLGVDLWTLDSILWFLVKPEEIPGTGEKEDEGLVFSLERHLQFFLRDNWGLTALGKEWDIFNKPGEPELGFEYRTEVGRIDLLAHHKTKPEWLVIELKRNQSGDETIGQVMRYIGWIRYNLAQKADTIRGLIIAHEVDASLLYAASELPILTINTYEVSFSLHTKSLSF